MRYVFLCAIFLLAAVSECQILGLYTGSSQRSLLPPAVSASGNVLVFCSSLEASPSGFFGDLYAVGADGTGMRRLTDRGGQTCQGPATNVSFSSDARWVAYAASNTKGNE